MNIRPIVGITMDTGPHLDQYQLSDSYVESVERAGGIPFPIPYRLDLSLIPQIVDQLDGIIFSGGDDLDPSLYGETWHPEAVRLDPRRQEFELALFSEIELRKLPTLCICLGCQLLNVYRGGSLIQFLPEEPRPNPLEHRKLDDEFRRHRVRVESDSALAPALGATDLIVNTFHKQAIARPGQGLRIVAMAPDGVVEAVEDPQMPMLVGVQWHPERLSNEDQHLGLFKSLVEKAREFATDNPLALR